MEKLKNIGLFELSLFATLCRSYVVGPNISDSLVVMSLIVAITYVKDYLNKDKIDDYTQFTKDLELIKNEISMVKMERSFKKQTLQSPIGVNSLDEIRRF